MSPLTGWVCWSPYPHYPQDSLPGRWRRGKTEPKRLPPPTISRPLLFREWMAAPARVRTSTPACTRGHTEGPSLARLPLSPYPSELRRNSAPRPSPRKSKQSNKPGSARPKPTRVSQVTPMLWNPGPGPRLPRAPPSSSEPRPSGCAGGRRGRGRGRRAGGGAEGGPRPRAGARRGPARCRCRRPERLQLQRRGRRQRGPGGGLRRGPARSRDYGGAERPLQDRGGGGRGVRQDGAAAGVRQGRLPWGEGPASWEEGAEAAGMGD